RVNSESLSHGRILTAAYGTEDRLAAGSHGAWLSTLIWRSLYSLVKERPEGKLMVQRSEEHTSELQSRFDLVCRLLLEINMKKLKSNIKYRTNGEKDIISFIKSIILLLTFVCILIA